MIIQPNLLFVVDTILGVINYDSPFIFILTIVSLINIPSKLEGISTCCELAIE